MAAVWNGVGGRGAGLLGIFTELVRFLRTEVAALKRCLASWATRRGGFGELEAVAGQADWKGRRRCRSEVLLGQAMLARIGGGVKAGVANGALAFRG